MPTQLLRAVRASNDEHKRWALRTVESLVDGGRQARRPRDRRLGPRLQAGDGHAAPFERGRALPGAGARRGRRESARLGGARRSGRPLRGLHAVPDTTRGGRRTPRRSSSRRTGPRTARSTPNVSWPRCGHRTSSMRTAFSSRRSAGLEPCDTSGRREPGVTAVLTGRAAIVTGGSHGLGLEIARAYRRGGGSGARLRRAMRRPSTARGPSSSRSRRTPARSRRPRPTSPSRRRSSVSWHAARALLAASTCS